MADIWQARREGHFKVVTNTIDEKSFTLPGEIVVMANDWQSCLRNKFSQGKAQRDVHGNRNGIFNNQQFDLELLYEFVESILEVLSQVMDAASCLQRTRPGSVCGLADRVNIRMLKIC